MHFKLEMDLAYGDKDRWMEGEEREKLEALHCNIIEALNRFVLSKKAPEAWPGCGWKTESARDWLETEPRQLLLAGITEGKSLLSRFLVFRRWWLLLCFYRRGNRGKWWGIGLWESRTCVCVSQIVSGRCRGRMFSYRGSSCSVLF